MKKLQKLSVIFLAMMLAFCIIGCDEDKGGDNGGNNGSNDIDWNNEANGTLTVINNTSKDMVLFQGQTPSAGNILGGVKGLSTKTFDISDDVDDFNIGGYMILRGISLDEYNANKTNLTKAKIEYSAMATYGQGKRFRSDINPNHIGDFAYRATNIGRIGIELRKD